MQALLNVALYVTFVLGFSLIASWFVHACLLKCAPLEVAIRILTVFVAPLSFLLAKSPIGLLVRAFGCAILAVTLTLAYENWLHSDSFPRIWLDPRAQEWMREIDQQVEEARQRAMSPSTQSTHEK